MIRFAMVCGAAALAAVITAKAVMRLDGTQGAALAAVAMAPTAAHEPASARGQAAQITKAADGHYWADASVNGAHVRFLVDTGATAVALSPTDALRLGFQPHALDYGYKVMTASGEARAARISLKSVSVAGARVDDVEAYVIEKGLETSLLGMTYLSRLEGFEATKTSLILRP